MPPPKEWLGAPMDRLEDVYVRNVGSALRFVYFLTGDREVAQDLVHEAFVRVAGLAADPILSRVEACLRTGRYGTML
jgi:DNA-directed RNA polymerase specialized sigma24 family protein